MFGYVTINGKDLTQEQRERYQSCYCGLCRTLGKQHGFGGRLTLSYDLTFLKILLGGLYETEGESGVQRCLPHPVKSHAYSVNEFDAYAADLSIALAYHNALDDWNDDKNVASLALAKIEQSTYLRISAKYPRQCAAICHCLNELARFERENSTDLDGVSNCFGELMAELFDYKKDEWSKSLRELGFYLGKFVYLMDAYEDLPRDIKHGSYNPFKSIADDADYEERVKDYLTAAIAACANAFERLPVLQDADILRNILYSGVWTRYAILQKQKEQKREDKA